MKNLHHHSRRHIFAAILGFSCLVIVLTALLLLLFLNLRVSA